MEQDRALVDREEAVPAQIQYPAQDVVVEEQAEEMVAETDQEEVNKQSPNSYE